MSRRRPNRLPIVLGIDPDVRASGIAVVSGDPPRLVEVAVPGLPSPVGSTLLERAVLQGQELGRCLRRIFDGAGSTVPDLVVVEVPQDYGPKRTGRADDLLLLAVVAGAATGALTNAVPVLAVRPSGWKGQVPKGICQGRILTELGIRRIMKGDPKVPPSWEVPDGVHLWTDVPESSLSEVADAAGTALWGWHRLNSGRISR